MNSYLEFLPEALAELQYATGDYEAKVEGLGVRSRTEVETSCEAIVGFPFLWRERKEGCRRVNLPGFPYYISYIVRKELILVVAVPHAKRHPDYWKNRLS